jgi:AAA15 family ATPase/GTPase
MLLRFSVENHKSLRDRQELSLVASSLDGDSVDLIDSAPIAEKVLPAAMIYGANASGKTNVLDALQYVCWAVRYSHAEGEPGDEVPRAPFALDQDFSEKPSVFEIDFVVDSTRYHYGFTADKHEFVSEWLYSFPKRKRTLLFERNKRKYQFGRSLSGRNRVISDLTRRNSLFLSSALQNRHDILTDISSFFKLTTMDKSIFVSGAKASRQLREGEVDQRTIKFLQKTGAGISGYRKKDLADSEEITNLKKEFVLLLQKHIKNFPGKSLLRDKDTLIELAHSGKNDAPYYLNMESESSGTTRLLVVLDSIFRALDAGSLIGLDEIDASLHTMACEAIISLFSSKETNPKGAQLVATTHDTNILLSKYLRRDQIWFTEKDGEGATHLYPLTDFQTRKNDNFEKGYLQGRYGAIPFSGRISDLFA